MSPSTSSRSPAPLLRASPRLALPAAAAHTALACGAALVYTHGLLRKGVGLCHGAAGSVCALLAAAAALAPPHSPPPSGAAVAPRTLGALGPWHARAAHLALLACGYEERTRCGEMGVPDRPYSLYEGVAGICAAWADVVCVLDGKAVGGMVGFADLLPSGIGLSTPY